MEITFEQTVIQLPEYITLSKLRVEAAIKATFEQLPSISDYLKQAMQYSLLNGGKRIRSALIYSLEKPFNLNAAVLDKIAITIECIHASSLIHDDLPALDDDALRRGQPSCHMAFNEAIAILAGDGLLNLSHQVILSLTDTQLDEAKIIKVAKIFSHAIGTAGMIGGQALEFQPENEPVSEQTILKLYELKTGCLLGAGIQMALSVAKVSADIQNAFDKFCYHLGLAFQVQDDILDIESNSETLGKPQNSDFQADKLTIVAKIGLPQAKALFMYHSKAARAILKDLPYDLTDLETICDFLMQRKF